MFRVITVEREYGSGGGAIARCVADRLGWSLLDKNLTQAVARVAQVDFETSLRYDECVDSWWHRLKRGTLQAAAITAGATIADAQYFDAEARAAFAGKVIEKAAAKGNCVIVGRGAQCVLQSCPEALHVFIYGPWSERVARVQNVRTNEDIDELIWSTDQIRAKYIRQNFGCDWKDPHLYHIMISSQIGEESAASLIAVAARVLSVPYEHTENWSTACVARQRHGTPHGSERGAG